MLQDSVLQPFGFLTVHVSISFPYQPMQGWVGGEQECLPSLLGAASGQGETLAARRFELSEELVRINTHSWVP